MDDEQTADRLVVNPSTRVVHRASCYRASLMQLAEPLPIEQWPAGELEQLRGCYTCDPDGWC